jgi:hypothetical protein
MNHTTTTTLGIFAVLTATMLMVGALVVMPAFANSGDGNTYSKLKNKSKTIASGFGTIAENKQSNCINFVTATGCPISSGLP